MRGHRVREHDHSILSNLLFPYKWSKTSCAKNADHIIYINFTQESKWSLIVLENLTLEKNFLLERNVKPRDEILWDQVIMSRTQGDEVQLGDDWVEISQLSLSARCAQGVWFKHHLPLELRANENGTLWYSYHQRNSWRITSNLSSPH